MTGMLRDLLNERADAAGSHDLDLHDLISQGERCIRRRRRIAVGGTVAAVVLTVGASFALVQSGDPESSPVLPPSTNPPSSVDGPDGSRPLTYGVGSTIHYGDRTIEVAEDAGGLYVFDDGLAILTGRDDADRDNRLYLMDGSEQVEIARGIERVTVGEVGTLLVWLDGDEVVIYDTQERREIARVPLTGRLLNPITPLEDAVYWHESTGDELVRYDVQTGIRAPASEADYRAEMRTAVRPILVVGTADSVTPAEDFTVIDSRLELGPDAPGASSPVFVAATGERLRVSVPDRYEGESLGVFQWLDDDRFALVADSGVKNVPMGDLLTCRISTGQCRTIATGEREWLLPGNNGAIH